MTAAVAKLKRGHSANPSNRARISFRLQQPGLRLRSLADHAISETPSSSDATHSVAASRSGVAASALAVSASSFAPLGAPRWRSGIEGIFHGVSRGPPTARSATVPPIHMRLDSCGGLLETLSKSLVNRSEADDSPRFQIGVKSRLIGWIIVGGELLRIASMGRPSLG